MRWLLLLALSWPQAAWAYRCKVSEYDDQVTLAWRVRSLEYGIHSSFRGSEADAQAAFLAWLDPCSDLRFEYVGRVTEDDPVNKLLYVESGWGRDGRATEAVAITLTTYHRRSGDITQAQIELNAENFSFGDASQACAGSYDLLAVLTHEVGHLLGFDHTELYSGASTDPTMAPAVAACETSKRTLEPDDRAILCNVYPARGPSRTCEGAVRHPPQIGAEAFGCTTSPRGELWALIWMIGRRRLNTCSKYRSGG